MSVFVPFALLSLLNVVLFVMIFRGIYCRSNNNRRFTTNPEKEFQMCKIIIGTIFICGLTWLFGFLVIIPSPPNIPYLGFGFALIFCILNAFQGFFIFIATVIFKKLEFKSSVTPMTNISSTYIDDTDDKTN